MSMIEDLIHAYKRVAQLPWDRSLAGAQKVWFVVYDQTQERRVRLHVDEFARVTTEAGHGWRLVDLTDTFARWMAGLEYREAYFASPEDMGLALDDYAEWLAGEGIAALESPEVDESTVVALLGAGALFGVAQVSRLVRQVDHAIKGRLLVFFPGQYNGATYRLLDARDGWNYLAIPITATNGM